MILLLAAQAFATDTYYVPSEYATLKSAVKAASNDAGASTIVIDAANYSRTDESVIITDDTVTIASADGTRANLPAIAVGSSTLRLQHVQMDQHFTVNMPVSVIDVFGDSQTCTLCAQNSVIEIDDGGFGGSDGASILALDSSVTMTTGEFSGSSRGVQIIGYATAGSKPVSLTNVDFIGVVSAIIVKGKADSGATVPLTLTTVHFDHNAGSDVPDIDAHNTTISGNGVWFDGSDANNGSPVRLESTDFTCTACKVEHTWGSTAGFLSAGGTEDYTVHFSDGSFIADASGVQQFFIDTGGTFWLQNEDVELAGNGAGFAYRYGGTTTLDGVRFSGVGGSAEGLLYLAQTKTLISAGSFCHIGEGKDSDGVIRVYGGSLTMQAAVAQGVEGTSFIELMGSADSATVVDLEDDTFIMDSGKVLTGPPSRLQMVNTIISGADAGLDPGTWPKGAAGSYNLWFGNLTDWVGSPGTAWGEGDVYDQPPRFIQAFDSHDCSTSPRPSSHSPVIDAGNPEWNDADGTRSDIGALDWDGVADTGEDTAIGDSGDSGGSTTDDVDGDGVVDADDCAPDDPDVHAGAVDDPENDIDEDCDGVAASYTYGGGCGCVVGSQNAGTIGALVGLSLLARRRRAERA